MKLDGVALYIKIIFDYVKYMLLLIGLNMFVLSYY